MSDDRSDRPEKEDNNSEESERHERASEDKQQNERGSEGEESPAPGEEDAGRPPEPNQGEKQQEESDGEFDDFLGEDYDASVSDDYDYDYDDYDGIEDYGFENDDAPKKPRSAVGRLLSRQRRDDAGIKDDEDTEDDREDEEGGGDDWEEEGMSFLEHLEEFRWTVARSVIAFIIGVAVVVIFHQGIAQWIQHPLNQAYGSAEVAAKNLITYKAMGVITVFFQIALLGGLTLSMPFVLYFMGSFVAPGLTAKERKVLRPACYAAFLLFLMGVSFGFFIILPLALAFTVRLNEHLGFDIFWAASDYYNMVVWFSLAIGFFFQFPLVVVILVYLGVLATETLKRVRRMVFVGLMVFSALVSPGGDPFSLAASTGFMYGLYELAILTGKRIERKKREAEEAEAEE